MDPEIEEHAWSGVQDGLCFRVDLARDAEERGVDGGEREGGVEVGGEDFVEGGCGRWRGAAEGVGGGQMGGGCVVEKDAAGGGELGGYYVAARREEVGVDFEAEFEGE